MRSRVSRPVAGLLFAIVATLLTGMLSAMPWRPYGADRSLVRLSWRAVGELVEECRRPTAEENAKLPAHMRREEICEGRTTSFVLRVLLDGKPVLEDTIRAAGARGDRPVYVFREVAVPAGAHDLSIAFDSLLPAAGTARERNNEFPEHLTLDTRAQFRPGDILLITYDEAQRRLVARSS